MDINAAFYNPYLANVTEQDVPLALSRDMEEIQRIFRLLNEENAAFVYAEGKWSVKEVIGHLIDCERIFAYRALCIARGEEQGLPGFDENAYAEASNADSRKLVDLLEEYGVVRKSSLILFKSMTQEMLDSVGQMSGSKTSVRTIGRIIAGHSRHHQRILQERYLDHPEFQFI